MAGNSFGCFIWNKKIRRQCHKGLEPNAKSIAPPARRSDWLGQLISSQSQIQDSTGRPLDYSINSYWINYWISFLVIFILLNKNFKKLFLFLMNKILGYLTIYSIILFFIIQLISLKIFRARSAREWIFIKRKKNFPKKPISELGTPPLKLNLPLL